MNKRSTAVSLAFAALAAIFAGCQSTPSYSPYIEKQEFDINGMCERVVGTDESVGYDCKCTDKYLYDEGKKTFLLQPEPYGKTCKSVLRLKGDGHSLSVEVYNVLLPCFPKEAMDRIIADQNATNGGDYDAVEEESDGYIERFWVYLSSGSDGASPEIAESIQLKMNIAPAALLTSDTCSYNIRAKVSDLPKGEYLFKLWNEKLAPADILDADGRPTGKNEIKIGL